MSESLSDYKACTASWLSSLEMWRADWRFVEEAALVTRSGASRDGCHWKGATSTHYVPAISRSSVEGIGLESLESGPFSALMMIMTRAEATRAATP